MDPSASDWSLVSRDFQVDFSYRRRRETVCGLRTAMTQFKWSSWSAELSDSLCELRGASGANKLPAFQKLVKVPSPIACLTAKGACTATTSLVSDIQRLPNWQICAAPVSEHVVLIATILICS